MHCFTLPVAGEGIISIPFPGRDKEKMHLSPLPDGERVRVRGHIFRENREA